MESYRKILLCYDGSREGRKALRQGANLALDLNAETHVLAVVDMRSSIAQSAGLLTDMACGRFEEAARDILQEGVDWLVVELALAHEAVAQLDDRELPVRRPLRAAVVQRCLSPRRDSVESQLGRRRGQQ